MFSGNKRFKSEHSFRDRREESRRVIANYPDRIPVICEQANVFIDEVPYLDKKKFLVPKDLTMGQLVFVIRKRMKLPCEKAIFIFTNKTIPSSYKLVGDVYALNKDIDGFLYVTYSFENVFG